jgi:hypothetical protein
MAHRLRQHGIQELGSKGLKRTAVERLEDPSGAHRVTIFLPGASWPSSVASLRRRMILSRLLVAVTIAGSVMVAAWALRFRGGRFGR